MRLLSLGSTRYRVARQRVWRRGRFVVGSITAIALAGGDPALVLASCDVLPSPPSMFRSALGSTDRPFAGPGDWITLGLDPSCDGASAGFTASSDQHIVTIAFRAPAGVSNLVVLADDCAQVANQIDECRAQAGLASITCIRARHEVSNGFGGTTEIQDILRLDERHLRFRFPDTDALLGAFDDDLTFSGPAALAVTPFGAPLACDLGTAPCAGRTGLLACVDGIFADDGSCAPNPDPLFASFVALPPPNDFEAICEPEAPPSTSPCDGTIDEIRFTVDAAGNLLLPVDWRGVLFQQDLVPVLRLVRGTSTVESHPARGAPIRIPDLTALKSFSPGGKPLPPLFDPLRDATASGPVTFFGSADAPQTILRIARHDAVVGQCGGGSDVGLPCLSDAQCPGATCTGAECVAGANAGAACASDADCPGSQCGPDLFDFSTRAALGTGPVLLRRGTCIGGPSALAACASDAACPGGQCVDFALTALDPVPLDGLQQSEAVNAFVLEESLEDKDLNGDGDAVDHVVRLGDRATGVTIPIGDAGAEALAVTRIQSPPFSFPAVAVGGELLAFLEPEPLQGAIDLNGDGDVADTILRAFRLDGSELTAAHPPIVADGRPVVNSRPITIANGRVFFRSSEAARAHQAIELVSATPSGGFPNGGSGVGDEMSADGRYVVFSSDATNLLADRTTSGTNVFWRDRVAGATRLVSVNSAGDQQDGYAFAPRVSPDGRYVIFASNASNLGPYDPASSQDTFLHDLVTARTEVVSLNSLEAPANRGSAPKGISADGRFVLISSDASNLATGDTNGTHDYYLRDRVAGTTERLSVATSGEGPLRESYGGTLSDDGRFAAFNSFARNLVPGDTNGISDVVGTDDPGSDIFVRDRVLQTTARVNLDTNDDPGIGQAVAPILSADGSAVTFATLAPLVPGDTNAEWDVYVRNLATGTIFRANVDSSGRQTESSQDDNWSVNSFLSGDGRFVAFASAAANLVVNDTNGLIDLFLHDTVTQTTQGISVAFPPHNGAGTIPYPHPISDDGRSIAFYTLAAILPGDTNGVEDVFVIGPDRDDCASDLTGDCDLADTVLQVLEASSGQLHSLCPATRVAVAPTGQAAFLRPEAGGAAPGCPAPPLNDADASDTDEVVQLWDGTQVHNLALAATTVAMSDDWIGALASEAAQAGTDFNNDSDTADTVAQVHAVASPGAAWINLGQAADSLDVNGGIVAFLTPERAQGNISLNGDDDADDRVLQVYDAGNSSPVVNTTQAAEEFVLGSGGIAAFRTREASQGTGGSDLNDDGDRTDSVLQVYDAAMQGVLSSGQAVTPCRLEACDPRVPYRVLADTVTFLTFEGDQQEDLNADGDETDLVLQVLNVRQATQTGDADGARHVLAATTAGVCTATGNACATDADCGSGACFVPPGGCLRDFGTHCEPSNNFFVPDPVPCAPTQFCQPLLGQPGQGVCQQVEGVCRVDADCTAGARCNLDNSAFNRIVSPLLEPGGGGVVFPGTGRCVENSGRVCSENASCDAGEFCSGGTCQREHGSCASDADCPPATTCVADLTLQTAADTDTDELPDVIDNCPTIANITQEDGDADGRGDACDAETCGNGVRESAEACDSNDATACPGRCSGDCACPCDELVSGAKVTIGRKSGVLRARLRVPLGQYAREPVSVRLEDGDGVIATRNVGALAPVGRSGRTWKFQSKAAGLRKLRLNRGTNKNPGLFTATVQARGWFDAASADGAAADTTFTLTIGGRCFATQLSAEPR